MRARVMAMSVLCASGCSFLVGAPQPSRPGSPAAPCSSAPVVIDALVAAAGIGLAVYQQTRTVSPPPADSFEPFSSDQAQQFMGTLLGSVTGAVYLLSAAYGGAELGECHRLANGGAPDQSPGERAMAAEAAAVAGDAPPSAPADPNSVRAIAERRERGWQLTTRGATAARAGDCATTIAIGSELAALDLDIHDTVFLRDAAIARCFAAAAGSAAP